MKVARIAGLGASDDRLVILFVLLMSAKAISHHRYLFSIVRGGHVHHSSTIGAPKSQQGAQKKKNPIANQIEN